MAASRRPEAAARTALERVEATALLAHCRGLFATAYPATVGTGTERTRLTDADADVYPAVPAQP